MNDIGYSAVIRTKNSAKTIEACIESLLVQKIPPKEIIIVDSGSGDTTLEIVRKFNICKVIHYPDEPFNYSKALNIGIREVTQSIVLNFSSHCVFIDQKSTEIMLDLISNNQLAIAVTFQRSRSRQAITSSDISTISYSVVNRNNFRGHAMDNPCAMIRKTHWEKRKFNEEIERCEDQDWAYYWIKECNFFSIKIDQPKLHYDNVNYTSKKMAKDHFTLSRHVHRYPGSFSFLVDFLIAVLSKRERFSKLLRPESLIFYTKLFLFLFYYKVFGRKKNMKPESQEVVI